MTQNFADSCFFGFVIAMACLLFLSSGRKQEVTFEFVHVINGHEYVLDHNLTEQDCISRLAPHNRNYCIKEN